MEKTLVTDTSVKQTEKPSIFQKLKSKLSLLNRMTRTKNTTKKSNSKDDMSFFDRNKYIFFIALAIISTFLIVSTIYKSIEATPIPRISNIEAQDIMSSLYSTQWLYDGSNEELPSKFSSKIYEKIEFSNQMDESGNSLAIKLFENDNDLGLGIELGYLYYNKMNQNLSMILPNNQELKFLYTSSDSDDIENLSLINDENSRIYFIKKEYTE
jgi:hypothetical protein